MLLALSLFAAHAVAPDDESLDGIARFGSSDVSVLLIPTVCYDGSPWNGEYTVDEEGNEIKDCLTEEDSEEGSLSTVDAEADASPPVLVAYAAKDAVLKPSVKDPALYYGLYDWWILLGDWVVIAPEDADKDETTSETESECTGDLTVTVSSKTSIGAAITLGTKSAACTLEIVVPAGTYAADLAIDRPTEIRAAKGASPVVRGKLSVGSGAWLVVDGVGLAAPK